MFQLVQVLYWLALSTWFGGVLFVAVAAPVIFSTILDADPTLPKVLSVNLERQHGTLLAGSIVANLLNILVRVQVVCAAVVLVTSVAHWFLIDRQGAQLTFAALRTLLFLSAVILLCYDWLVISPKLNRARDKYIDHADEPEIANPAKDRFDYLHHISVTLLRNILFLLLGLIIFSGDIRMSSLIYISE